VAASPIDRLQIAGPLVVVGAHQLQPPALLEHAAQGAEVGASGAHLVALLEPAAQRGGVGQRERVQLAAGEGVSDLFQGGALGAAAARRQPGQKGQ
jgi:hypothetical protein